VIDRHAFILSKPSYRPRQCFQKRRGF